MAVPPEREQPFRACGTPTTRRENAINSHLLSPWATLWRPFRVCVKTRVWHWPGWTPASAGVTALDLGTVFRPVIPAKAGIHEFSHRLFRGLNLYLSSLNLTPMRAHSLAVGVRIAVPSWFGRATKMKRVRQAVPLQQVGRAVGQLSKVRCYATLQRKVPRRRDSHTNLNKPRSAYL